LQEYIRTNENIYRKILLYEVSNLVFVNVHRFYCLTVHQHLL